MSIPFVLRSPQCEEEVLTLVKIQYRTSNQMDYVVEFILIRSPLEGARYRLRTVRLTPRPRPALGGMRILRPLLCAVTGRVLRHRGLTRGPSHRIHRHVVRAHGTAPPRHATRSRQRKRKQDRSARSEQRMQAVALRQDRRKVHAPKQHDRVGSRRQHPPPDQRHKDH